MNHKQKVKLARSNMSPMERDGMTFAIGSEKAKLKRISPFKSSWWLKQKSEKAIKVAAEMEAAEKRREERRNVRHIQSQVS